MTRQLGCSVPSLFCLTTRLSSSGKKPGHASAETEEERPRRATADENFMLTNSDRSRLKMLEGQATRSTRYREEGSESKDVCSTSEKRLGRSGVCAGVHVGCLSQGGTGAFACWATVGNPYWRFGRK